MTMSTANRSSQPASNKGRRFIVKPYNKTHLCRMYDLSRYSLAKKLAPLRDALGPKLGSLYTPRQVEIIFQQLGWPERDEWGNLING